MFSHLCKNAVCCLFAFLRKERSPSKTQQNFAMSKIRGVFSPKIEELTWLILGRFSARQVTKLCRKQDRSFYPASVIARCDYGANGKRWRRIANVNETIEIKSPLSQGPKVFKLAMAALCGNISLIDTFSTV